MTAIASDKKITVNKLLWATGLKVALTIVALVAFTAIFIQKEMLTVVYLAVLFVPPLIPIIAVGALIVLPVVIVLLWIYIHFYVKSLRELRRAYARESLDEAREPQLILRIMAILEIANIGLVLITLVGLPLTLLAPLTLAGATFAAINGYIIYVLAQQDALLKSLPQSEAPKELPEDAS